MSLRVTQKRIEKILRRVHEEHEARRSAARTLHPYLSPEPAEQAQAKEGPIHGWGRASESQHRKRGAVSPLGGVARTPNTTRSRSK
jgi:hypothetical protein